MDEFSPTFRTGQTVELLLREPIEEERNEMLNPVLNLLTGTRLFPVKGVLGTTQIPEISVGGEVGLPQNSGVGEKILDALTERV